MSTHPRTVYVNDSFVPFEQACVPIMDRGFLFADGVYEVTTIIGGRLVDNDAHLARLFRSLKSVNIPPPFTLEQCIELQKALIAKNQLGEGIVYIHVTRGVAERDFSYDPQLAPSVVMFTQSKAIVDHPLARTGARVISTPDLRWVRRDIKSIALLAQVLAKQEAKNADAYEAIMHQDGLVTEGSSSSFFIIPEKGTILVRPLSQDILPGITRASVLELARQHNMNIEERSFTLDESLNADEAFLTGAVGLVMPVISIDGITIGDGKPGPMTQELRRIYLEFAGVS